MGTDRGVRRASGMIGLIALLASGSALARGDAPEPDAPPDGPAASPDEPLPAPPAAAPPAPACPLGAHCEHVEVEPPVESVPSPDAPPEEPSPEPPPSAPEPEYLDAYTSWEWSPPPDEEAEDGLGMPLLLAGAATFLIGYVPAAAVAGIEDADREPEEDRRWGWLALPLAGPFVALETGKPSRDLGVVLVVDGVVQLAGAALACAGAVLYQAEEKQRARAWIVPLAGKHNAGLGIAGAF